MIKKKTFERKTDELKAVFNFLKKNGEILGLQGKQQFEIELSVEEVFMNMLRHNSQSNENIEITIEKRDENKIIICLIDHEDIPFDITSIEEVDLEKYIEDKKTGGLGIHLIKQLMDEIKFEHRNGVSSIQLVKQI